MRRDDRRLAIAAWAAMFAGGAALGPVVGGWLLEHFWWGSVFFINVPIIAFFLVAAPLLVPESRDPRPGRIDVARHRLSMTAMLPFVFGIKQLAEHGRQRPAVGAWCSASPVRSCSYAASAASTDPLIDVGAVLRPGVQRRHRREPAEPHGLRRLHLLRCAVPPARRRPVPDVGGHGAAARVCWSRCSLDSRPCASAASSARVLVGRASAVAAGYAIAAFLGTPSTWSIMIAFAVLGLGIGLAETLTNDLMLAVFPPHKAGAASAISETAYEVGAVLGTAVLGSVLTSTYRSHLTVPAVAQWGENDFVVRDAGRNGGVRASTSRTSSARG